MKVGVFITQYLQVDCYITNKEKHEKNESIVNYNIKILNSIILNLRLSVINDLTLK